MPKFFLRLISSYLKIAVCFSIIILMYGCIKKEKDPVASKPDSLPYIDAYSGNSPFKQKIPYNPEIELNSDKYVQRLKEDVDEKGFMIAIKQWTMPLYYS